MPDTQPNSTAPKTRDPFFQDIAEQHRSGDYYSEALKWYQYKYIFPVIERAYLMIALAAIGLLTVMTFSAYDMILPITKEVPFIIENPDTSEFHSIISPLEKIDTAVENPELLIAKEILSHFVTAQESYNPNNNFAQLLSNQKFIQSWGSDELQKQYAEKISLNNPNSLVMQLKRTTRADVTINPADITLIPAIADGTAKPTTYQATIPFTVQYAGERKDTVSMQAKIDFTYSGVTYDKTKHDYQPTSLTVTRYESNATTQPTAP